MSELNLVCFRNAYYAYCDYTHRVDRTIKTPDNTMPKPIKNKVICKCTSDSLTVVSLPSLSWGEACMKNTA